MNSALEIFIDGACSGNPGPATAGIVIYCDGKKIKEIAKDLGSATNNIAEYNALIYALQEAFILKAKKVKIYSDSELLCRQVAGEYKVKNGTLKPLFEQIRHLISGIDHFEMTQVPREENKEADRLASSLLKQFKKKQTHVVASLFDNSGEESPSSAG